MAPECSGKFWRELTIRRQPERSRSTPHSCEGAAAQPPSYSSPRQKRGYRNPASEARDYAGTLVQADFAKERSGAVRADPRAGATARRGYTDRIRRRREELEERSTRRPNSTRGRLDFNSADQHSSPTKRRGGESGGGDFEFEIEPWVVD